jgi:hypothetical protein
MGEGGPKQRPIPKALPKLRFSFFQPGILITHRAAAL